MRPMELKEPANCCRDKKLNWNASSSLFVCSCGQMKVDEFGRVKGKRQFFDIRKKKD